MQEPATSSSSSSASDPPVAALADEPSLASPASGDATAMAPATLTEAARDGRANVDAPAIAAPAPRPANDADDAARPVGLPPQPHVPPAISTYRLTMTYGRLTALNALTLELEKGDIFGFIGPNGAGKSTTMKILAGLLRPTSGIARILGKTVAENGDFVRRNVGYMPDFIGVYEDLTVAEYLEFFASAYGLPRRQRKAVVASVLELTDLKYKEHAMVDSLSRGMTQRLSLARILVHDPPVLLLDEPASGLDPRARIEMKELLKELRRLGKTILVSSHILEELGAFCNKLGIIERGQLLHFGTPEELRVRARAHAMISIRVVGSPDAATQALLGDTRIERIDRDGDELQVVLVGEHTHHHFLIERLVSSQIQIESIAPHQLKLEDVFLRLTKGAVQ